MRLKACETLQKYKFRTLILGRLAPFQPHPFPITRQNINNSDTPACLAATDTSKALVYAGRLHQRLSVRAPCSVAVLLPEVLQSFEKEATVRNTPCFGLVCNARNQLGLWWCMVVLDYNGRMVMEHIFFLALWNKNYICYDHKMQSAMFLSCAPQLSVSIKRFIMAAQQTALLL